MNDLLRHPEIRVRMGKASRVLSLAHHKPTVLARLEALYGEVIQARRT